MKNTITLLTFFLMISNAFSQSFTELMFRKPTVVTSNGVSYFKFASVTAGIDAYVTITGSKNAIVQRIDDSTTYRNAWQPYIRFTNSTSTTDTSYVDFNITFRNSSSGNIDSIANLAMTIVGLDGNGVGSYREMVSSSLPATPKGIAGSTLSTHISAQRLTMLSGVSASMNNDTSNYASMSQINYNNVTTYTLRVGILGSVNGGTNRQFSFYFKPFSSLMIALPVKLADFTAAMNNEVPVVKWTTTSEENASRFEIYRSLDGVHFTLAGTVAAAGNSQQLNQYRFADNALYGASFESVYYKLRIVDNDEQAAWSKIAAIGQSHDQNPAVLASVYPNPCQDRLHLSFSSAGDSETTVDIVDMFGRVHRQFNNSDFSESLQLSADLSDLASGIYFVRVGQQDINTCITFTKN